MVKKIDICPSCGGALQRRGYIKRILRVEYGEKVFIKIPRYSCKKCGKWHRFIPDYIEPYKHYRKDILEGFRNDSLGDMNIEYLDFPSDISKYRWKKYPEGKLPKTK